MSAPRHTPRPRHIIAATLIALVACSMGGDLLRATGNIEVITEGGTAIGNRVWAANTLPVVWVFNHPTSPAPSGCNYNASDAAVHAPAAALQFNLAAAFQAWEDNPDATIDFTYGGTTTVRNEVSDGVNVVTFCQNDPAKPFGAGVIARTPSTALTTPTTVVAGGGCVAGKGLLPPPLNFCFPVGSYPAGTIVDSDVAFNRAVGTPPDNGTLSTDLVAGTIDVMATAVHEIGHFHGLSHNPMNQAVMYPFIDVEPPSDPVGGSQRFLRRSDLGTSSRYYPTASFGTLFGTITGQISLNGNLADGVHVAAIDPNSGLGVMGRFALSRFEDPNALGPDGPDVAANNSGFYRIDGLPPGGYYVYVEYFDDSDFFSGRLLNRYNTTVLNSNVVGGTSDPNDQAQEWMGFMPALTEFYNTGDSGNGGDGVNPGTALDNSDAATLVTVTAGATTPGIDIAINIEPVNGQTAVNRQNPTTRSIVENDLFQGNDLLTVFHPLGGPDAFYAVRFPAASLPAPPYNVAEGLWVRAGRNDQNYVSMLAFVDPNVANVPDIDNPLVPSAGRSLTGGPNGLTVGGDFIDVRDQWNVTVNQSRDVYVILNQPLSGDIAWIGEGYFVMVTCLAPNCPDNRVERTLVTEDGGATWGTITNGDVLYDLILEQDPPVMITGATPSSMNGGVTGDVDITGVGFQPGAAVSFGPNVTVNLVTFMSPTLLRANITAGCAGLTVPLPLNVKVTNPDVIFPNVSRVFTLNPPVGDLDCDGTPDVSDCAPGDPALEHGATEVAGFTAASGTQLTWDSQDFLNGTATVYDLVTGLASDLRTSPGFGLATCELAGHPDTPFAVAGPDPPLGAARYWLVRARNTCGTGTYGDSTILPDPRDALDAGAPACP